MRSVYSADGVRSGKREKILRDHRQNGNVAVGSIGNLAR